MVGEEVAINFLRCHWDFLGKTHEELLVLLRL